MSATKIEWCHESINPFVGCSKCSPGCDNCYAEKFAYRHSKNPATEKVYAGVVDEKGRWTGTIHANLSQNMNPHRVPGKGKRVFVGSMTDIFHPNFPDCLRDEIFASIMADCTFSNGHGHTFIILTKRPQDMAEYFSYPPDTLLRRWGKAGNGWIIVGDGDSETFEEYAEGQTIPQHGHEKYPSLRHEHLWPLPNLWLGVTVCNQAEADAKIPALLATPAAKRFVSIEPMLGPVDLTSIDFPEGQIEGADESGMLDALRGLTMDDAPTHPALDWVICGGETGPGARPMHPDWVRGLRDQCNSAEVPFFFKSWGEWSIFYDRDKDDPDWRRCPQVDDDKERYLNLVGGYGFHNERVIAVRRVGKKRAGRLLDGQEYNEIPEGK